MQAGIKIAIDGVHKAASKLPFCAFFMINCAESPAKFYNDDDQDVSKV